MSATPHIRRELRSGDLGRIIAHHGTVYAAEHDVDARFEADVAASVAAAAAERGWPSAREGVWIVELDGEHAGSLALTDEGNGRGAVRWFVLDRALRGAGLGRRLVAELIERAERSGYEKLFLDTFSELRSAARIYRSHGFELRGSETGPRWGRERITYQRYELSFQERAQASSSESAGSRARPFSVSA